jgi:hypothetical protein
VNLFSCGDRAIRWSIVVNNALNPTQRYRTSILLKVSREAVMEAWNIKSMPRMRFLYFLALNIGYM